MVGNVVVHFDVRNTISGLAAISAAGVFATTASAVSVGNGTYVLYNHPDGNAAPPPYGLRLDGLFDGNPNTIVTFDFEADGAKMYMTVDVTPGDKTISTVRIFGTALGGVDVGTTHYDPKLYNIDFTYVKVEKAVGDDDLISKGKYSTGTLGSVLPGTVYNLGSAQGDNSFAFRLGDESSDAGHRGHAGVSGWGWINHVEAPGDPANAAHLYDSDWLFVAKPVPTPTAFAGGAVALLGLMAIRRRRG